MGGSFLQCFFNIICNGNLTNPFFLGRGVRQGYPLSPLLYVLLSEVLSTQIHKCREIEGFRLPDAAGLQFKISQYADDATNFVINERSLHNLLLVVNKYERVPNSILPSPRPCGLGSGGLMAPPPMACDGSTKSEF